MVTIAMRKIDKQILMFANTFINLFSKFFTYSIKLLKIGIITIHNL